MHRATHWDAAPQAAESGQTMTEYAVVLGVIVIVTMAVFIALGDEAGNVIKDIAGRI
jgi:Flp pilus assembly pilin Flp